ncbi:hypothetical protein [Mesorhizobium sp. M0088]|uniref:hypothetical protein n=1 Tax=Mesorhizobium sp. M0088 TaxID=2956873 RepID=UPI00333878D1
MSQIITNEINERRHRVIIDRHELKRIIAAAICSQLGIKPGAPGQTMDFKFQDEMEGSPGYKVGVGCIVDIVEDLLPQPQAAA